MARTYQSKRGQGTRAKSPRRSPSGRPVPLSTSKKRRFPYGDLKSRILRAAGSFLLFVLVAVLGLAAGGYLGLIRSVDQLVEQFGNPQNVETHPTYIYSAPLGGNEDSRRVIGTIFQGENRKTASREEMPLHLLNALVAKEALIAVEIERREPSKDQILADYLNTVYFGNNEYGVEAAAETYFNKSVEDLTVAESATLVGLLWSPSTLGEDREAASYQRDLVLTKMFDTGYVPSRDYNRALEEPLPEAWPVNFSTR